MKIKKLLGKLTACALSIGMTLSVCGIGCRNEWQTVSAQDLGLVNEAANAAESVSVQVTKDGIQAALNTLKSVYPGTYKYFTSDGKADYSRADTRCYLPNIPARGGLPTANAQVPTEATCTPAAVKITADEAIAKVKAKVGTSIDYDGESGPQCVDLVMWYYEQVLGVPRVSGNANSYATNALPAGWTRGDFAPQKGDIIVGVGGEFGHVSIYESDYSTYHQNYITPTVTHQTKYYKDTANGYRCVIRPDFKSAPPTKAIQYAEIDTSGYKIFTNVGSTSASTENNVWQLDIREGATTEGTNIGTYYANTSAAHRFKLVKVKDKTYKIEAGTNEKLLLNLYGTSAEVGCDVNLWRDKGNDPTQWWLFEPVQGGYILHNAADPNCVLYEDHNTLNVLIAAYDPNNKYQVWSMETVGLPETTPSTKTTTTTTAPVTTKAPVATTTTTTKATTTVTTTVTTTTTVATATLPADQIPFSGKGSENEPYLISCKADLIELSNLINNDVYYGQFYKQWYRQTADIDLGNEKWSPIAKRVVNGIDTGRSFSGHYDGDQHSITGLYVAETSKCAGLFGSVMGSTIENLAVYGSVTNTGNSTGGIIGEMCANNNRIENCCFIGDVTSTTNGVGGIVGLMWVNGQIKNCYHIGKVISKQQSAGGIAGYIGKVNNDNSFVIENCYHVGEVSGAENSAGSILGIVVEDRENTGVTVNIKNCFALNDGGEAVGSGKIDTKDVSLLNADLLRKSASLISDSFADSPDHDLNDGYPVFVWQLPAIVTTTTTTTTTTTEPTITTTTTTATTTTTITTTTTTTITTTTTTAAATTIEPTTTIITTVSSVPELQIDKTDITLSNGEQYTIIANRSDVTYKSNNPDAAIVSAKGVITAVGVGQATISVIDSESNVVQIKVEITAVTTTAQTTTTNALTTTTTLSITTTTTEETTTATTTTVEANPDLQIENTSITIANGEQYTVAANRSDVTYKSNNPNVAIVSAKGVITAVGVGQATISVIDSESNVVQIKVEVTAVVTPPETDYLLGDVNDDGEIGINDAQLALNAYVDIMAGNESTLSADQLKAADVNGDNEVSVEDAQFILIYYVQNTVADMPTTWKEILNK